MGPLLGGEEGAAGRRVEDLFSGYKVLILEVRNP